MSRVDVVHPRRARKHRVASVRENAGRTAERARLTHCSGREQWRSEHVGAERPRDRMHDQTGKRREIRCDAVGDQMHPTPRPREVSSETVVGAVHAAERGEITRRDQPGPHAPSRR